MIKSFEAILRFEVLREFQVMWVFEFTFKEPDDARRLYLVLLSNHLKEIVVVRVQVQEVLPPLILLFLRRMDSIFDKIIPKECYFHKESVPWIGQFIFNIEIAHHEVLLFELGTIRLMTVSVTI